MDLAADEIPPTTFAIAAVCKRDPAPIALRADIDRPPGTLFTLHNPDGSKCGEFSDVASACHELRPMPTGSKVLREDGVVMAVRAPWWRKWLTQEDIDQWT